MKYLWRFYFDCGRMGSLRGLFVATEEEINCAIGKAVHFGEVLGKHSEVSGTLDAHEISKVNLDSETVVKVSEILGDTWSGYNPLDYIQCLYCYERASDVGPIDKNGMCQYCEKEESEQA